MRKLLILILVLGITTEVGYLGYQYFFNIQNSTPSMNSKSEDKQDNGNDNQIPIPNDNSSNNTPKIITYGEEPAKEGAKYFEKIVEIKGQYAYIAYPLEIQEDNPPTLIVYSHGSNTLVTNNMKDPFMKDLQIYGEYFTKSNFAFAASNMHGANWGSDESLKDIDNMRTWIESKYLINEKINLLGFSMGGLPTFNYAFKYPNDINLIALLAPTSRTYTKGQLTSIKNIPIQIWHGDADVNVPLSLSRNLLSTASSFGLKNINLIILDNKGHFDIDMELRKEILKYFTDNE